MARVFLDANESNSFNGNVEVYGNSGIEGVLVRGAGNKVQSTVERVEFTGALNTYTFGITGNVVTVKSGSTVVATITVPDTANGQTLVFADGSAALKITGLNAATLGGAAVPTTAAAVAANLNSGDTSVIEGPGNMFTLTESVKPGEAAVAPVTAVYWGYNPNGVVDGDVIPGDEETTTDGGIPVAELLSFVTGITGLDLAELGLVDDDGVGPFDNVTNLTLSNVTGDMDDQSLLTISFADGTSKNAEVELGDQYLTFLNNLLFDSEGNSRLFEKIIIDGEEATDDTLRPIILTTNQNNGGTEESGFTTAGDDLIVAGRLELLHGAYIDGGAGYNTLEIDAKGTYAQPKNAMNIQEIRVQNLPNAYTIADGDGYLENSNYPQLGDGHNLDSIIDLSRAIDIEKLVVNEGYATTEELGDLTIVGIRNGATTRLEGGFVQDVTLQYGQGLTGTLNLELAIGDVTGDIKLLQNAAVLNIDSQGVENHMHDFFAGGSVSRMIVTGTGAFGVDEDLADSFNAGRPAIIDASANTGGLDVTLNGHYNVTVKGTVNNDEITATDSDEVTVIAGNGKNVINVDGSDIANISSGTGDDNISAQNVEDVTIVAGDGKNLINADGSEIVDITTGAGNDNISAQDADKVTISAGDGNNVINADNSDIVDITTGAGNDTITAIYADTVSVAAGNGANIITVRANDISVTTGTGNDRVTVSGLNFVFDNGDDEGVDGAGANNGWNDDNYGVNPHFTDNLAPGALLTLDLGAGVNTVNLGLDVDDDTDYGVTALAGSVITGSGIKLFVENHSDLTEADLSGATITSVVLKQELRITADQFSDIGAAAFSVLRDEEGATEDLYIVVSQDATLSDMVNLGQLNTNVRLHFELKNGAELTLSAQELHTYVAWHGIVSDDGLNGSVVITDAGLNYDAFDTDDNYKVIDGGTLTGDFADSDDVTIIRTVDGWERPTPTDSTDTLTVDSDVTAVVETAIISEVATLKVIGAADVSFENAVDLGRDADAATLADGRKGDLDAPESDLFTFDFTGLTGDLNDLTIANFQDVKQIKGNVIAGREVRIDVELTDGSTVGAAGNANGLKSTGVQTYVVTAIGDDSVGEDAAASEADFYVCDLTKDVTTLGLRGNYNDTINFLQVNWGTNFLLEGGGTAKADGNPSFANIGSLYAEYFWGVQEPHADAVVDIVNLDGAPIRPLYVAGIEIDNADSITVNVAGESDLTIASISGNSVDDLTFVAAGSVTVLDLENAVLDTLDASGVAGTFTIDISDGAIVDLSGTVVTGLDAIVFSGAGDLTLTTVQLLDANISSTNAGNGSLSVTEYAGEAIDFTAIDVAAVETVTFSDSAASPIVVDSATVFGNFDIAVQELVIVAEDSDTTVEMTAAQFNQLDGSGTVTTVIDSSAATGEDFEATLVIGGLVEDEVLVLNNVDADVVVRVDGVVATDEMSITGGAYTLEVAGGVNDLTEADLGSITAVNFTADATLTLTAAQVLAIDVDDFSAAAGVTVTLNITDLSTQELDLDEIAAAGINIGTITILDTDAVVVLDGDTTLGDADSIVVEEDTTVQLTAEQFEGLDGTGTITGAGTVNITDLTNDEDTLDVSGVTAEHGTITLGEATVTLDALAALGDFAIQLAAGQMIQFATAEQANGATVNEVVNGTTTAIAWLFDNLGTLTEIDTTGYESQINTLYILQELVDGQNEESLWNTLPSTIHVEKTNLGDIPDVLIGFDRVNTFQALSVIAGVSYDDQAEFQTIENLTINLEGNTNIGNVTIGDTNGEGNFQSLTINSYEDRSTLGDDDSGFDFQPNKVGNIGLNAGTSDALVNVTLNTYDDVDNVIGTLDDADGFLDVVNVTTAEAERDGLALEVGTITFAATDATPATLTLTGAEDITIAGVDISDAEVNLLTIDASAHTGELEIGSIGPVDGINDFDYIYVVDGFTAEAGELAVAGDNLLVVAGGDNDLTEANTADLDQVHFTQDGTLTLTAAQIIAIGEGNFSIAAGVTVTLNVTELGNAAIDLGEIQDAGINIGEVFTVVDDGGQVNTVLNAGTTLGDADQLTILMNDEDNTLTLTAEQYQQINGGNIVESDSDLTSDNNADVTITDLIDITNEVGGFDVADIDLSTVLATGDLKLQLADAGDAADITFTLASDLGEFAVVLDSQGLAANDLLGQTVRFANAAQAERDIEVENDGGVADNGTNVVWNFTTITGTETAGKVDTSGYDAELGRVWMTEELVDDANVEELFTSLAEEIIIRVVNSDDLTAVLPATSGFDRVLEIESFTTLGSLSFNDIDQAGEAFDFVENLTISLGGNVVMEGITVSNVLAAPISNNDEFDTLTINSFLASFGSGAEYLLPEGYDYGNAPGEIPYPTATNQVGDIQSGIATFDLLNVVINTDNPTAGTNDLTAGTVTFNEDGDDVNGDANVGGTAATFTVNGDGDVTLKSLDTSDVDISSLNVTTTGTGDLTITGGSPAIDGGDSAGNTETLNITNGGGEITFGSAKAAPATGDWAGVYGEELSLINLTGTGIINLGTIADVDNVDFEISGGFTGDVTLTLGEADANGLKAPELAANGTWTFDFAAANSAEMTITEDVVFNAGARLEINSATVILEGDVDLSILVDDILTGAVEGLVLNNVTFDVPAGQSLTLTAAQADGLIITGAGTVEILNLEATPNANLSGIFTTDGDTGTVNAALSTADDSDVDLLAENIVLTSNLGIANVTITGTGTVDATGATIQNVDRNDPATVTTADDATPSFVVGAGATLTLGADQVGDATGAVATSWNILVSGAGAVAVTDLAANADADLSGLTATTVTAVTNTVVFTGDLGTAVVTVNNGQTLTAAATILDGLDILSDGADPDVAGVTVTGDATGADLSGLAVETITIDPAAIVEGTTFPTLTDEQTLTLTSVQADGETINGATGGTEGTVEVNIDDTEDADVDSDVDAFNLSLIAAGTMTATINDTVDGVVVFDAAVDFGAFDIVITAGNDVTMTGAQANGLTVTETGVATLTLTGLTSGVDLTGIAVTNVEAIVASGAVDLSAVTGLTAIDVEAGANADLTLGAEQFSKLNAGDNVFADDLAELNSLTVDVSYTIGATTFAVDLTVEDAVNPATWTVSGDAAGFVQAQADDTADGDWFTTNVLDAAESITHTDLGSLVSASSGAIGFSGVVDSFVFDGTLTAGYATAVTNFDGFGSDGDKIDLSFFNDSDNSATTVAGALTTTANEVYFLTGAAAGAADSLAAATAALNAAAAWTETADLANTTAYIVISDDNSTSIFKFVDIDGSVDEVAAAELTAIGTVDAALVLTDLIA